jgi:hypothetical protein
VIRLHYKSSSNERLCKGNGNFDPETAVDRAKPQSGQMKPETCSGHVIPHFSEFGSKPNFLIFLRVLCNLCGKTLFLGLFELLTP